MSNRTWFHRFAMSVCSIVAACACSSALAATQDDAPAKEKAKPKQEASDAEHSKKDDHAKEPERLVSRSPKDAKYQITIDYTEAPELADWVKNKLQPTCDAWYPKIVEALPSKDYTAPDRFTIEITNKYRGVAATMGTRVVCNIDWFKHNLKGEAPGAVVHEMVHVVQQYRRGHGGSRNPGWLVEGIADYIRWFKYEPRPTGTRPRNPDRASYTDSYRTTAGFLNYVTDKHDKQLVKKLNAAMRQGKYDPDLWKEYAGKPIDDLWKEYVETLQ